MSERTPTQKLHAFDADGTLLKGSILDRAFWKLAENGVFELDDSLVDTLKKLRETPDSLEYIIELINAYMTQKQGQRVKDIKKVADELAEVEIDTVFPEMKQEITKRRQEAGSTLIIISGSPQVFVNALAKRLGFDFSIGSHYPTRGGLYHPHREYKGRADKKHLYTESVLRKLGRGSVLQSAYGDTMSDLSLLESAEEPAAVNPTDELRKVAVTRRWRVIDCVQ